MAAPTVERQLDLTGLPIVRGTWPEGAASGLDVALGGRTYTLGRDANLAAREGTWSLIPSAGLKDGIYDVVVTATGADGTTARDEGVAEIEVDAIPPAAPVVTAYAGEGSPAAVTGTWPEEQASGLKVTIPQAKLTAELGTPASPLTSDGGGNWSFALPAQLAPGSYDVEVSATDNRGRVLTSTAAGGLVIAAVPPPPPPVPKIGLYAAKPAADATWPFAITGRWSEGTAIDLTAELAGRRYALGRDAELTSDGTGRFTFAPQADSAPPGQNSVTFSSKGPAGDTRIAEVLITVPAPAATEEPEPEASASPPQPAQPVVPEKPFSCETVLSRLNQVFPVRFGFNRAKLEGIASLSLSQYAALLKDPRCASLKLEIGGHADYYGPESYNVWLSELRANTVLAALKEAGISDANISIKGYGESSPLDPAQTTEARQKNRRVEFTAVK
jgi:OOP family OmpA-OmpF porin